MASFHPKKYSHWSMEWNKMVKCDSRLFSFCNSLSSSTWQQTTKKWILHAELASAKNLKVSREFVYYSLSCQVEKKKMGEMWVWERWAKKCKSMQLSMIAKETVSANMLVTYCKKWESAHLLIWYCFSTYSVYYLRIDILWFWIFCFEEYAYLLW